MPRKPRRTPIERYIEDGGKLDRRGRWEARQREAGITRCTLRVHVADLAAIKRHAATLLNARQLPHTAPVSEQPPLSTGSTPIATEQGPNASQP